LTGLKKSCSLSLEDKLHLINPEHPQLSINKQCALLQVNRSTYYNQLDIKPLINDGDEWWMKEVDRVFTQHPYYGSRRIAKQLKRDLNRPVNRKRSQRLMRFMGIEAIHPRPNTSRSHPENPIYPYLLKGLVASHPNHIWGVDITYIPLLNGWLYLVALLDWYSRYIVAWELSDTMEAGFCAYALEEALNNATPIIHNSDQGSQFTSQEYLSHLWQFPDIQISMDGRGRAYDNIFTERLWRTIKYEEVYLHDYLSPKEARESLKNYINTYNHKRLHSSLRYHTPAEIYYEKIKNMY